MDFGTFVKIRRRAMGLTLREFCRRNGFDPGNISRYERGIVSPPVSAKARRAYAKALGISAGSVEWREFHDLAALWAGRLPTDMASDKAVLSMLPLIFCARREKQSEAQLDWLIALILRQLLQDI